MAIQFFIFLIFYSPLQVTFRLQISSGVSKSVLPNSGDTRAFLTFLPNIYKTLPILKAPISAYNHYTFKCLLCKVRHFRTVAYYTIWD